MPDDLQYVPLPDGSYAALPNAWTDDQVDAFLKKNQTAQSAPKTEPFNPPRVDWRDTPGSGLIPGVTANNVIGAVKGAANTAIGLGEAIHQIPGVSKAVDTLYGTPGLSDQAFTQARQATAYQNPGQQVGGAMETAAELMVPVGKAAEAVPRAARAGARFQQVMGAAAKQAVPITQDVSQAALRVQELAERGRSMPQAVRKFILRVTDPEKAPLAYQESRDFASAISELSASEKMQLTPQMAREVANLRVALNKANGMAASAAGKGAEYAKAMNEYARAMRLRDLTDAVLKGAKKALPYASGGAAAGGAYWLTKEISDLLGSGD